MERKKYSEVAMENIITNGLLRTCISGQWAKFYKWKMIRKEDKNYGIKMVYFKLQYYFYFTWITLH